MLAKFVAEYVLCSKPGCLGVVVCTGAIFFQMLDSEREPQWMVSDAMNSSVESSQKAGRCSIAAVHGII